MNKYNDMIKRERFLYESLTDARDNHHNFDTYYEDLDYLYQISDEKYKCLINLLKIKHGEDALNNSETLELYNDIDEEYHRLFKK
ncbi:Hypothetical protein ORPV_659 [Orpheovirus IHUMI-LCC2]|uniref:Uncharacterized protein n=1 Tax=Orpheovirus IHUMI-LCC2 TaxID=2023057 RepID=A0A2I2L4V2_9VIRU|nr:Hypothetical protein ORPV_659 [Orpheovirus IHUMI-LCC2]SNW62563.1 Hypothetical protein ORPV_659 [Orpheovirus IHUMI-LCC2]